MKTERTGICCNKSEHAGTSQNDPEQLRATQKPLQASEIQFKNSALRKII